MNAFTHPISINRRQVLGVVGVLFLLSAPWSLPLVVSDFWVTVLAEILIWSLFASSVNLLLGYTGLLSFGQALYFGMGAYGMALGVDILGLSFWPAICEATRRVFSFPMKVETICYPLPHKTLRGAIKAVSSSTTERIGFLPCSTRRSIW